MNEIRINHDNVWFFSDPHFYHKNLVRGTSKWGDRFLQEGRTEEYEVLMSRLRDFKNPYQMNDHFINNINSMVDEDAELFCLGDWCFGDVGRVIEMRNRIVCKRLHLILGNHDKDIRQNKQNVQSVFTSVNEVLDIYVQGQHIVLYHYSQRIWNKSHRGTIMLYGHSHGHLPQHVDADGNAFKTMDVGMDAIFNEFGEYRPLSFTEIRRIMEPRVTTKIDHHR